MYADAFCFLNLITVNLQISKSYCWLIDKDSLDIDKSDVY